jgi:hypothetical protein
MHKPKRDCLLRYTRAGTRVLLNNQSLHNVALDQDPPEGAALTISVAEAQRLTGLSRATINRLMKAFDNASLGLTQSVAA